MSAKFDSCSSKEKITQKRKQEERRSSGRVGVTSQGRQLQTKPDSILACLKYRPYTTCVRSHCANPCIAGSCIILLLSTRYEPRMHRNKPNICQHSVTQSGRHQQCGQRCANTTMQFIEPNQQHDTSKAVKLLLRVDLHGRVDSGFLKNSAQRVQILRIIRLGKKHAQRCCSYDSAGGNTCKSCPSCVSQLLIYYSDP